MIDKTYKRMSISLPPELDRAVLDLRKTEEYCRCSYVEIVRVLMAAGAKAMIDRPNGSAEK